MAASPSTAEAQPSALRSSPVILLASRLFRSRWSRSVGPPVKSRRQTDRVRSSASQKKGAVARRSCSSMREKAHKYSCCRACRAHPSAPDAALRQGAAGSIASGWRASSSRSQSCTRNDRRPLMRASRQSAGTPAGMSRSSALMPILLRLRWLFITSAPAIRPSGAAADRATASPAAPPGCCRRSGCRLRSRL